MSSNSRLRGMTKRRSALLAATLLMLAPPATARELPPPVYPMATPTLRPHRRKLA